MVISVCAKTVSNSINSNMLCSQGSISCCKTDHSIFSRLKESVSRLTRSIFRSISDFFAGLFTHDCRLHQAKGGVIRIANKWDPKFGPRLVSKIEDVFPHLISKKEDADVLRLKQGGG